MKSFFYKLTILYIIFLLILSLTTEQLDTFNQADVLNEFNQEVSLTLLEELNIPVYSSKIYTLHKEFTIIGDIPDFVSLSNLDLVIEPKKQNIGTYTIYLIDENSNQFYINITVNNEVLDTDDLVKQLDQVLQDQSINFGIYVYDLNRDVELGINYNDSFRAASIVKIPIAIAILNEVEEGRLTLDQKYPINSNLVFNNIGLGSYSPGTALTIREYLEAMIKISDNTALSHLDLILQNTYGSELNTHLSNFLKVNFFVYPPETTPKQIGIVFKNLYSNYYLAPDLTNYLIGLMQQAVPDLRAGIGLGLPNSIIFANKIGFLDTNEDLSYMDSAIVYGKKTDYILVIMNRNQNWLFAQNKISEISKTIYNSLNQ